MSLHERAMQRAMAEEAARAVPMSTSDKIVITQAEPDAPGVYIDATQLRQDAYVQQLAQQQQMGNQYVPPVPPQNPNYRVAEPTTMTATPDGKIIIY